MLRPEVYSVQTVSAAHVDSIRADRDALSGSCAERSRVTSDMRRGRSTIYTKPESKQTPCNLEYAMRDSGGARRSGTYSGWLVIHRLCLMDDVEERGCLFDLERFAASGHLLDDGSCRHHVSGSLLALCMDGRL